MDNIKVSLTVELEGRTLIREDKSRTFKYIIKDNKPHKKDKKYSIIESGEYIHTPVRIKEASQHINLSNEAYDYMTSTECPSFCSPRDWNRMKSKEKLESHLKRICDSLCGKSFTYQILPD